MADTSIDITVHCPDDIPELNEDNIITCLIRHEYQKLPPSAFYMIWKSESPDDIEKKALAFACLDAGVLNDILIACSRSPTEMIKLACTHNRAHILKYMEGFGFKLADHATCEDAIMHNSPECFSVMIGAKAEYTTEMCCMAITNGLTEIVKFLIDTDLLLINRHIPEENDKNAACYALLLEAKYLLY